MAKAGEKNSLFQKIALYFYEKRIVGFLLWVLILGFGALSYTTFMTRKGFPNVAFPLSTVSGVYAVNDAAKVDADIAKPLSEKLSKLDTVKTSQVNVYGNNFFALVQYKEGVDAKSESQKLEGIFKASSPPQQAKVEFKALDVGKFNQAYDAVVSVYNTDGTSPTQAQARQLADVVAKVHNVAKAEVLEQSKQVQNPATGESVSQQIAFDRVGEYSGAEGKGVFYNSYSIGIVGAAGSDDLTLYDDITATLAAYNKNTSAHAVISANFAESIREQLGGLQRSLIEGLIVVVIVSFALINWRVGLSTALSMVTVLLATVGVLYAFGQTLNTITLFGLVLALSLIVDDTTIVAEALDKARKKKQPARAVIKDAISKVARASLTGTVVTSLAFAPLLFVGGVLGSFIKILPMTIITAILLSLVISLTLIPLLAKNLILADDRASRSNPITKFEEKIRNYLVSMILHVGKNKKRKFIAVLGSIVIFALSIGAAGYNFSQLKFDIFPASKNGNELQLTIKFDPGTTPDQAKQITDETNDRLRKALGSYFVKASYTNNADAQQAIAVVTLTPFKDRALSYIQLRDSANSVIGTIAGATAKVDVVSAGPPKDDLPLAIRIVSDDSAKADKLSMDMKSYLSNHELTRQNGKKAKIIRPAVTTEKSIKRVDGKRITEVRAAFTGDDISLLVKLAQKDIQAKFSTDVLKNQYGLGSDALQFDFGNEGDNQDSFNTMVKAFPILLAVMYVLMLLQFRSFLQPLLIFLAIPFSWFGVSLGLRMTQNPISFFVMVGFFALIGIAVNNTILLTDYANKELADGKKNVDAIASALRNRFRPLLTTSVTSVVALVPLVLNDPFWESLAVTLMFGLISSTVLVLLTFPYFWLGLEMLRTRIRRLMKRALNRP